MIRKLIHIVLHNIWYKLAALVLAIIVWGIVQGEEVVEYNRRIKANISVADGFAIKGRPYRYLEATLRGPRVLLGEIANKPIEAKIFVPADQTGAIDIPFDKDFIKNWDHRIKITTRESYISIFVDEKISREVPIREVLQGVPADGYFVERVLVKPERVKVTGIKPDVAKLVEVVTDPIDIANLNETKTFTVGLVNTNFDANAYSEDQVKVTVQIGDSRVNKRFPAIPIEAVGGEYQSNMQPKYVSIVIQGTPGVLGFVDKSDLRAFIELNDLKPGRYDRSVQVKIPPDTVLIETFPQKVQVEVLNQSRR